MNSKCSTHLYIRIDITFVNYYKFVSLTHYYLLSRSLSQRAFSVTKLFGDLHCWVPIVLHEY